eukprot:UN02186
MLGFMLYGRTELNHITHFIFCLFSQILWISYWRCAWDLFILK